jgi:hypothetical protein
VRACVDICRWTITFTADGDEQDSHANAPSRNLTQERRRIEDGPGYGQGRGRLLCGLHTERAATGAWDMQVLSHEPAQAHGATAELRLPPRATRVLGEAAD